MPKALWAPWRMQYLKDDPLSKVEGCLFCALLKADEDRNNLVAFRGKSTSVILNKYPYNNGHVMVLPNEHVGSLDTISEELLSEVTRMTKTASQVLRTLYNPDGFNIGMNVGRAGGAGIPEHLHMHIVPRWGGDTNFMPVLADTKSMPEHLMHSFDRIHNEFKKRDA